MEMLLEKAFSLMISGYLAKGAEKDKCSLE